MQITCNVEGQRGQQGLRLMIGPLIAVGSWILCSFLQLHSLLPSMHTAVKVNDGRWAGVIQVHSLEGLALVSMVVQVSDRR